MISGLRTEVRGHQAAVGRTLLDDGPDHLRRKALSHDRPALLIARNSRPEVIPAGTAHSSITLFSCTLLYRC